MTTAVLGQVEAALLQADHIRMRAAASSERLHDLRWQILKELARPRPGDAELGLLDGIDLRTLEWTAQIAGL